MNHQQRCNKARGSLFAQYFISFICIILVPIIAFSSLLYIFVSTRMDMEIDSRLESTAQALAAQMDSMLIQLEGEITRFALELESSDLMTLVLNTEQRMQKLAELRTRLESSASTNTIINIIGIYFGDQKKAITQRGYYPEGAELDWESIRMLLYSDHINGIHSYRRDDGTIEIVVAKSIPIHQRKGRNFIFCTLDGDVLSQYAQFGWEEADSFLLDAQNNILASSRMDMLSLDYRSDFEGAMTDNGNRHKAIASKVMPWKYVISIPNQTANADIIRFLWIILLIVIALSGLGIAFSYMMAHVFYKPIAQLAHSARMELSKIQGREITPSPNDILFINQAVNAISAYGTALEQCLDSGRGRVLSSIFRHLLDGNAINQQEVHEILENYMFDTSDRQFTIFVVELRSDDINQKWDGWISRYQLETFIKDALCQMEEWEALAVEMEKYRLCGVITRPAQEEKLNQKFFELILERLGEQWPYARIAVGDTVYSLGDITGQYIKAERAISSAPVKQSFGIVDIAGQSDKDIDLPGIRFRWLESVANNILVEDLQAVNRLVDEWVDSMVMTSNVSLLRLQESALQITAYLGVVLKERMPEVHDWPAPITLKQASNALNPEDVCRLIQQFCIQAVACIQREMHQHGRGKIDRAVQYVDAHYREDISLTQVADLMDMTPQYLSSTFKSHVGKNFTEYINHMRLENAARLLKQTALAVQEISEQSGYNSVQYFTRKFKEMYGITPTQYRENALGE